MQLNVECLLHYYGSINVPSGFQYLNVGLLLEMYASLEFPKLRRDTRPVKPPNHRPKAENLRRALATT